MQRSVSLNRSPLSKLVALRARARAIKLRPAAGPAKPKPAGPPAPMAEQLSRSPEIRITSLV